MLIKSKGVLVPISIEFRKCLIQETILQLKITIEKIHSKYKSPFMGSKASNAKESKEKMSDLKEEDTIK